MATTVLLADSHEIFRRGVGAVLHRDRGFVIVAETGSGNDVLPLVQRYAPKLVLLDVELPEIDGFRCLEALKARHPPVNAVVLTESEASADVGEALRLGARGYIFKTLAAGDLADALRRAMEEAVSRPIGPTSPRMGDLVVTAREAVILGGVARGLTNRGVARELSISELTVKFHLTNIYRKLGAANRTAAVRRAVTLGIVVHDQYAGIAPTRPPRRVRQP